MASRPRGVQAVIHKFFNRRYATFGLLADAEDVLGEGFDDPLFVSPEAPRSVRLMVSWRIRP